MIDDSNESHFQLELSFSPFFENTSCGLWTLDLDDDVMMMCDNAVHCHLFFIFWARSVKF
jgi:hypothetical protein